MWFDMLGKTDFPLCLFPPLLQDAIFTFLVRAGEGAGISLTRRSLLTAVFKPHQ